MSLRDLYQEMIIDHSKVPRNFGNLPEANHSRIGHNPLCGDKLVVYLFLRDNVVEKISFKGMGCAISIASASLMTEAVKGKSREEIEKMFTQFHRLVTIGHEEGDALGKLLVFAGVAEFPVRVKCATLAWHTLKAALTENPHPVSTE